MDIANPQITKDKVMKLLSLHDLITKKRKLKYIELSNGDIRMSFYEYQNLPDSSSNWQLSVKNGDRQFNVFLRAIHEDDLHKFFYRAPILEIEEIYQYFKIVGIIDETLLL